MRVYTHTPIYLMYFFFFCNFVCFRIFFLFFPFCALLQLEMFHIFMYLCHIICNKNKSIRTFLWKHYGFNADNSTAIKVRVCVRVCVVTFVWSMWLLFATATKIDNSCTLLFLEISQHGTIKRANWVLQNWQCLQFFIRRVCSISHHVYV